MNQKELLVYIIQALNKLNIPYMITGAYAASFYGEPRTTHDIDLNADIGLKDIVVLREAFKDGFYINEEMIKDAITSKQNRQFNIIHLDSGIKIDFWLLDGSSFDEERFNRRMRIELFGVSTSIATAEDTILIKLKWYKESASEKHIDDVKGILKVSGEALDLAYIGKWAKQLNVLDIWQRVKNIK